MDESSHKNKFESQKYHLPQVKASTLDVRIKKLQALKTAIQSQRFALYEALRIGRLNALPSPPVRIPPLQRAKSGTLNKGEAGDIRTNPLV